MERVQIFLKTELFSLGDDDAIPPRTLIVEGQVREQGSGGLLIDVQAYMRASGKVLEGKPQRLFLPMSKIDHIRLLSA